MKRTVGITAALAVIASSAFAALPASEQKRLDDAGVVVRELRATPEKGIPDQLWQKAECVAVIPSMKKAAFVFGGEYGKGVMSCRSGSAWSAPIFLRLAKGSWGLQIGAEETDLVLLVMNRHGVDKLLQDKVSLGADVSVAAGPVGREAAAATDAQMSAEILSYSRSQGAFAGINLSGGVLQPEKTANVNLYGASVDPREVLFGHRSTVPVAARGFVRSLSQETRATTGRK